jgi:hypothetical protein
MAEKQRRSEPPAFYTAKATFYHRGTTLVLAGHTVAAGHPLLRGRKALFEPFAPTWPLEDEEPEPREATAAEERAIVATAEAEADVSARTDPGGGPAGSEPAP